MCKNTKFKFINLLCTELKTKNSYEGNDQEKKVSFQAVPKNGVVAESTSGGKLFQRRHEQALG